MMQGTHQLAQKFTSTGPVRARRSAEARAGVSTPSSAGSVKSGGARPISAEGTPRGLYAPLCMPCSMP